MTMDKIPPRFIIKFLGSDADRMHLIYGDDQPDYGSRLRAYLKAMEECANRADAAGLVFRLYAVLDRNLVAYEYRYWAEMPGDGLGAQFADTRLIGFAYPRTMMLPQDQLGQLIDTISSVEG